MENTAKNFALQLGSLIALYVSIGALLTLLFGIITKAYPDATDTYYTVEGASESIRFAIAMLIVFFPTYLVLTRMVNRIRREAHGTYLTLTRWLIYLSLLVGGAVILGDLVSIIYTFLQGDLAIRFILKALSVLIVVGAAFTYYLLDARGYWQEHEKKSIQYGGAAAVLVLIVLVIGFRHTETPSEVREMRIDSEQITDLQDMQFRIEDHYRINNALPATLEEAYGGLSAPEATEGRAAYEYTILGEDRFELCAEFRQESSDESLSVARPVYVDEVGIKNPYNWDHGAGRWCFERVIATGA